ncbi:helix-turn-helix transcriptional regulator [Haloactinomyces albus]|uniref:Excisionase family DNA binding protein n=1 Tax=Haloactinomyces albus TaxID=1352928 RepID=A0AAE3ZJA3_9ACTN|nr:helix-turn-helix domain-containing protein [Haloactinomyces albus]MDR7301629.1 excisionase family DNA binding protein [Haloactinomyces albus]MDR7304669.1 excisionase family DNA binding protein [Haloactinomyces albus]MDR7304679.1 excisionase family DNA binding protein [Haloactinomyces albus]MDR7304689.1 excisionase family DNA binding protein [Haloactinomyces albus]MDR7304699.1 excisionase family DNA binding protein [Haloactinomyces albus]
MQDKGTRMYRVKAVAERYDVSVDTIYRAIESGQLDALKLGTGKGTLRIPEHALRAYEEACSQAAYDSYVLGTASAAEGDEQIGEVA